MAKEEAGKEENMAGIGEGGGGRKEDVTKLCFSIPFLVLRLEGGGEEADSVIGHRRSGR